MLKKINRLTKQRDFEKVFKNGRSVYDRNLGMKCIKNEIQENRYGIVISAKISKKAVERNRLKRQIRETIIKDSEKLKNGYDVAIITFPNIILAKPEEIEKSLKRAWAKLNLITV